MAMDFCLSTTSFDVFEDMGGCKWGVNSDTSLIYRSGLCEFVASSVVGSTNIHRRTCLSVI
jgi:hypothetical protein